MARWLIALEGSGIDLNELPAWFPSGEIAVIHDGDRYYIGGGALDSATTAVEALDRAEDSMADLIAVARLLRPDFDPPMLGAPFWENDEGVRLAHRVMRSRLGRLRLRGGNPTVFAGDEQDHFGRTDAQRLLAASRASPNLQNALTLWQLVTKSWGTLYCVCEEIETYLGEAAATWGLCSVNERDRFRRSADNARVSGLDARHADRGHAPPQNPMSLNEATEFVGSLLKQALRREDRRVAAIHRRATN